MSSKLTMLASTGLTAFALLAGATAAEARTAHAHGKYCTAANEAAHHCVRVKYEWVPVRTGGHKHMRHHVAGAAVAAPTADVSALQAKVDALQARLDAAEAAQRATADQTNQVAGQQAAMTAQLASNNASVNAQVKSAINAAAPKANWTADTTVSGRMFFNISNINLQDTGKTPAKQVPSGTGFDIKRLYLGVNHTFDKHFAAGFVIDAQAGGVSTGTAPANAPGQTATRLNGANFYVKNAYLQYKLNDAFVVRAGASDMPWIPFAEGVYGNRYVENVILERVSGFGNSADWGVHVNGILGDAKSLNVTYAVSAVDGAGYRNPVRSNSVDLEGRVALNYHGAVAAVGGYTGKLAADVQNVAVTAPGNTIRTATRFNALLGYVDKRFHIGAEYFWAKDFSQAIVLGGAENVTSGYSGYGMVNITPKFAVFGRYDTVKPSDYLAPHRYDTYYNLGVTYSPAKIVDLSLVYKHDAVKTNNNVFAPGTVGTSNGTIGTNTLGASGTYDEIGLFGQWRF